MPKSENQSDIIAGVDLTNEADVVTSILIDLAQRETKNSAVKFAQALVPELQRAGEVTQKSHRFAGFVVLKAPDVPSVLIEVGYLSSREDESVMNTNRWRKTHGGFDRACRRSVLSDQPGRPQSRGGTVRLGAGKCSGNGTKLRRSVRNRTGFSQWPRLAAVV